MSWKTADVYYEIDSSKGMGQKYNTCLTNLARYLGEGDGEDRPIYHWTSVLRDVLANSWLGREYQLTQIRIDRLSRTRTGIGCTILSEADPLDFVQMPWGLTHLPTGSVVLGVRPRDENIIWFNVLSAFAVFRRRENQVGLAKAGLSQEEWLGICEAWKSGFLSAGSLAVYLTYGTPEEVESSEGSLLRLMLDEDKPSKIKAFTPPSFPEAMRRAQQYLAWVVRASVFPANDFNEASTGHVFTQDDFPVAPAAEQARFAQLGAAEKSLVDALLDHQRYSREAMASVLNLEADITLGDANTPARQLSARAYSVWDDQVLGVLDVLQFMEPRTELSSYAMWLVGGVLGGQDTFPSVGEQRDILFGVYKALGEDPLNPNLTIDVLDRSYGRLRDKGLSKRTDLDTRLRNWAYADKRLDPLAFVGRLATLFARAGRELTEV